ncbi:sulfite exporter TauE/SafE family protein [Bifidobacterium simiarum]|uniref:sulfite exporter TauE/SafE family protein n=1 Tax=Bifidobacterium simiarum TaxID=2045441 RepID=UPI001BDC2BED|nr:sulfite exporter TauE/SafE family protein [Bifidobacterium simiarum]MBT1167062.1 sulfite exporter TauE/SafE family protein [Bifidobacterium simiarum]
MKNQDSASAAADNPRVKLHPVDVSAAKPAAGANATASNATTAQSTTTANSATAKSDEGSATLGEGRPASHVWMMLIGVGLVSGVLSGLFGIGGGTVIVPALVFLGLSQRHAAATSLAAIVPTSVTGVISYATGGNVDWIAALLLVCGMLIGSQIGSWLLSRLPEVALRWVFVVFLCFVITSQIVFTPSRDQTIHMTVVTGVLLALLGVVIGTLAGLLGIGGGAVMVPALSVLFGASDLIARGTSLLAMFPSSIAGTAANWRRKLVHLKNGLAIGITAAIVAPFGTMIAGAISPRMGANLFAIYLGVLLIRSLWTAIKITPGLREKLPNRK